MDFLAQIMEIMDYRNQQINHEFPSQTLFECYFVRCKNKSVEALCREEEICRSYTFLAYLISVL